MNPNPSGSEFVAGRSKALILVGIGVIVTAHVLYLSLLITCDLLWIARPGFVPQFEQGRVMVADVEPGSLAAGAGLMNGDRILRANGQPLFGYADWQRVGVHFDPARPLVLELQRGEQPKTVALVLATGLPYTVPSIGMIAFRAMQLVTIALGVLVAFRRYLEPSALLGALLLASLGTVSLVLPMRLAVLWNELPAPLGALLWFPFTMSGATGPIFFAFAAVFPRRTWPKPAIALALVPGLIASASHLYVGRQLMQPPGSPTGVQDGVPVVFLVNVIYAAAAIALLLTQRRAANTLTDRRRLGVLILGTAVGAAAAVGVFAGYWRNPGRGIFTTVPMTLLSLGFLAMPAGFAYAILRHRLFDLRLIVRQGLQYALARRMVDALIPALGALLVVDVVVHRHESLAALIERRGWWYLLMGAALVVVRSRRETWLTRLDRRFFRERYDAERLLRSIADQVQRAATFQAIEHSIVQQIDEALHPTFVKVLRHLPSSSSFSIDSRSAPTSDSGTVLPASLTVIKVLSALGQPLALALGDTAWVRHQLPVGERALLLEQGIELLVPISGRSPAVLPAGLLLLGPRRSDEPYNAEDIQLLAAIADALGALLERSTDDDHGIAECERCGRCYDGSAEICVADNHRLTRTRGMILINGRYQLDARLGRGGMGTVYAATDTVLERAVAVKVIRDDLASPIDLAARFHREARVAAGFSHPHVVRIYDFGIDGVGRPFLVMELLAGETLRERLRVAVRLDPPEVLEVMRGVCSALTAAHDRGLVHRDLKPENIHLQRHAGGPLPKVLDFGLAKALDRTHGSDESTGIVTGRGMLIGTLDYMAPEQIAGDDVSPAWDVWALAVIGHEMLTGRHPFRGPTLNNGMRDDACATKEDGAQFPPPLASFFARALSPRRAERPQSAAAFLADLEQGLT